MRAALKRALRDRSRYLVQRSENLKHHGFDEGVSTRLLVYAAQLIVSGVGPVRSCDVAISRAVSDDPEVSTRH